MAHLFPILSFLAFILLLSPINSKTSVNFFFSYQPSLPLPQDICLFSSGQLDSFLPVSFSLYTRVTILKEKLILWDPGLATCNNDQHIFNWVWTQRVAFHHAVQSTFSPAIYSELYFMELTWHTFSYFHAFFYSECHSPLNTPFKTKLNLCSFPLLLMSSLPLSILVV